MHEGSGYGFVSSFFANKAHLCTLSTMSFAIFPQNMQIKGQYLKVDATND